MKFFFFGNVQEILKLVRAEDFNQQITMVDFRSEACGKEVKLYDAEQRMLFCGEVMTLAQALQQPYDFFVVFAAQGWQNIYDYLGQQGVPANRILSYRDYYLHAQGGIPYMEGMVRQLVKFADAQDVRRILDADSYLAGGAHFSKPAVLQPFLLFGVCETGLADFSIYRNLYEKQYESLADVKGQVFDLLLKVRPMRTEAYAAFFAAAGNLTPLLCCYVPEKQAEELQRQDFSALGCVSWTPAAVSGAWLLLDYRAVQKIEIYVVTHKEAEIPLTPPLYIPIQAGRAIHPDLGYTGDDTGDNISALNPYLNECTALYWIWKHAAGAYIGLVHYRRYFIKPATAGAAYEALDEAYICGAMRKYDILVGEEWISGGIVSMQLDSDIGEKACAHVLRVLREVMAEKQPEYVGALDYVMTNKGFFRCNMFVMPRAQLDHYCTWLFSFLPEVVAASGILEPETKLPVRSIGFFAERMLTVWLMKQELRIGELPILSINV